jgi:hypothetical protein
MTSNSAALVTWNASTDTVGVAGYQIARNGTTIASGWLLSPYPDMFASSGSTYQVLAFNLGYNGAPQSSAWSAAVALQTRPAVAAVGQVSIGGHVAVQ